LFDKAQPLFEYFDLFFDAFESMLQAQVRMAIFDL